MYEVWMVVADDVTARMYSVDRGSGQMTLVESLENSSGQVDRRFASEIARRIEEGHAAGRAPEIALVMPPPLLDLVRARLEASARNAIFSEVGHRRIDRQPSEVLLEVMESRTREIPW